MLESLMTQSNNETSEKLPARRFREMIRVLRNRELMHGVTPEKIRQILEDLGPTFVKLGQIMSMRSDFLPQEYCDALTTLQADVRPMPFETVLSILEREYKCPWQKKFASISQEVLDMRPDADLCRREIAALHIFAGRPQPAIIVLIRRHCAAIAEIPRLMKRLREGHVRTHALLRRFLIIIGNKFFRRHRDIRRRVDLQKIVDALRFRRHRTAKDISVVQVDGQKLVVHFLMALFRLFRFRMQKRVDSRFDAAVPFVRHAMRLHSISARYLVVKPFPCVCLPREREDARACQKQRAKNFRALTDSQSASPPYHQ